MGEHQINWGSGPSVAGQPTPADYAMPSVPLLASAMRKVLMSEDMYVDDDSDRLLLDGHVHGGLSADELTAVRAVVAERRGSWKDDTR